MATKKKDTTPANSAPADTSKKKGDALDTAGKMKDNAVKIGTAPAVKVKFDKIVTARDAIDPDAVSGDAPKGTADRLKVYKLVLNNAACAHRTSVSDAAMKAAGVDETIRTEYLFKVTSLYRAAVNCADKLHGSDEKARKATRNALFTEWKNLLVFLTCKDIKEVKASPDDAINLMNAATRTVKGGVSYESYKRQDGTTGAKMVEGVASSAAVSMNAFQKELERNVVDRLLGFDGIMSYDDAKDATKKNADLRADAVRGVALEKADDTTAAQPTAATSTQNAANTAPIESKPSDAIQPVGQGKKSA